MEILKEQQIRLNINLTMEYEQIGLLPFVVAYFIQIYFIHNEIFIASLIGARYLRMILTSFPERNVILIV